jgi:hypothetical protein
MMIRVLTIMLLAMVVLSVQGEWLRWTVRFRF